MKYSRSDSIQLHKMFQNRFGELPDGLAKHAANQGEGDRLKEGMEKALKTGELPNWADYVTPYPKRSSPT